MNNFCQLDDTYMKKLTVLVCALHNPPLGYAGGGLFRFIEVLKRGNAHGIDYVLVENGPCLKDICGLDYQGTVIPTRNINYEAFDGYHSLGMCFVSLVIMCKAVVECIISGVKWVRRKDIDLILSAFERAPTVFSAYLISKLTGRPWTANMLLTPVYDVSGTDPHMSKPSFEFGRIYAHYRYTKSFSLIMSMTFAMFHWMSYRLLRRSLMIAINKNVVEDLKRIDEKIRVIQYFPGNGIDFERIDSIRSKEKEYAAMYAGAIDPGKGVYDAIKAWTLVTKKMPDARLLIIGKGPRRVVNSLKMIIKELKLSNDVVIPFDLCKGAPKQEDLWSYMKQSKLFLYPSLKDAWAGVMMEALACGILVVAYDTPANKYAFGDCEAVFRTKVKDIEVLVANVMRILKEYNGSRMKIHVQRAKEFAKQFNYDKVVEAEKQAYLKVIKNWQKRCLLLNSKHLDLYEMSKLTKGLVHQTLTL